ncbi:MAG: PQQ-binding-like beta-propeller repeat protein [Sphingomonadales bacterium]
MKRSRNLPVARLVLAAILVPMLAVSCGKKDSKRLKGERISVMAFDRALSVDPRLSDVQVRLPKPYANESWPQAGGFMSHALHHLALGESLKRVWQASIGTGHKRNNPLVSMPVVADGRVFTIDPLATVTAIDATSGRQLWQVRLKSEKARKALAFGGGVAYDDGKVYVTTGYGFAAALDAHSGVEIWREDVGTPLRGAPTVNAGRVFVPTYDSQLYALSADDGKVLWYHVGTTEAAGIMGAASPAVVDDIVVVAYSSGELAAIKVENGRAAWTDTLTRTGKLTPIASISDIDGLPVIDRGRVYAISHGGRMVAIDLRSGERVWERNIGGVQTPWIAGDFIYLLTNENEVVCLSRRSGRVRWIRELQKFEKQEKRKKPISWSGPVLASDRLVLVSSHGFAVSISPYTGEIMGAEKVPDGSFLPPIVANETLYILTKAGRLVAMR